MSISIDSLFRAFRATNPSEETHELLAISLKSISRNNTHLAYRFAKRVFDIVFSVIVIVLLLLPSMIFMIVLALDTKGTPLYLQTRIGKRSIPFTLYKFRTMVADSNNFERYLSPVQMREWEQEHKVENDPRVTKLGSFLRKTSLDEFPQFLNVLSGKMSIVGPRPVTAEELHWFGDEEAKILSVKPGVTGWWQVMARNDASFASGKRQKLELWYVDHASLGLDVRIFFKTFASVISKTGY